MSSAIQIRPLSDDRELAEIIRLMRLSFGKAPCEPQILVDNGYAAVAVDGAEVVGGGLALPFEQYFGGRPVPSGGLAWLAVAPWVRGRGIGNRIIADKLEWLRRERGAVIACMWTPTVGMYRKHGWEVGAVASSFTMRPTDLPRGDASYRVVALAPDDYAGFQRNLAGQWNGPVRRPAWWYPWKARCLPDLYQLGVTRNGLLRGYASVTEEPVSPWGYRAVVHDFWAADLPVVPTLLEALTTRSPQAREISFRRSSLPRVNECPWALPQYVVEEQGWYPWMVKISDFVGAMEARGWPSTVDGIVEVEVTEPGGHPSRYVLHFGGGKARVEPGGAGRLRCTEGAVASWYTGVLPMRRARALGLAAGSDPDVELLDALTSGFGAWLPDIF